MRKRFLSSLLAIAMVISIISPLSGFSYLNAGDAVGNDVFEAIREIMPTIWDETKGVSQPVFSLASANLLTEEVWIELPVETFATGQKEYATDQRDLICVRITRPNLSAAYYQNIPGIQNVKLPVMLEHSPYRGNNHSNDEYVNAITRYHPNTEDPRRETPEFGVNPDTSHYNYADDVSNKRLALSDWPFDDDAHEDPWYHIPASRGAKPIGDTAKSTTHLVASGALNASNYMFARGFARINSSMPGNRYSFSGSATAGPFNDGMNTYGEAYEMLAGLAVIKWLNGECRAYTTKAALYEAKADWASGDVVMMGTSYNGTVCMGVASAGDERLRAIVPVAGISVMYEYFRTNGTVYPWSQGEDVDQLSRYDMGRWQDPNFVLGTLDRTKYENVLARAIADSSHETGDYNEYWDISNFTKDAAKFKAAVLFTQGQQDRNVGTQHFDQLYRALKEIDPDYPMKVFLHLSGHTTMWNFGPMDWLGVYHKWLDHFVYGIDNGIDKDGISAYVADSVTGQVGSYATWPIPDSEMRRYYFDQTDDGGGQLVVDVPKTAVEGPFYDQLKYRTPADIYNDPTDRFYNWKPYAPYPYDNPNSTQVMNSWYFLNEWMYDSWEATMLFPNSSYPITAASNNTAVSNETNKYGQRVPSGWGAFGQHPSPQHRSQMANVRVEDMDEILKHTNARLAYVSEPLSQDVILSGVPSITLEITPDRGVGNLSAMIVDLGEARRHFSLASNAQYTIPAQGEINAYSRSEYRFSDYITQYHVVSISSVDIQNPNPSGVTYLDTHITRDTGFMGPFTYQTTEIIPGETYSYTFTLEPRHYTFREGNRLAVVVYTTDYKHTQRPPEATELTLTLGAGSYIDLPLTKALPEVYASAEVNFFDPAGDLLYTQMVYKGDCIDLELLDTFVSFPDAVSHVGWLLDGELFTGMTEPVYEGLDLTALLVDKVSVTAKVTKQNGNTNLLTITLTESYSTGEVFTFSKVYTIHNNAADIYEIAASTDYKSDVYKVYVDTKGNDQIRACFIVE